MGDPFSEGSVLAQDRVCNSGEVPMTNRDESDGRMAAATRTADPSHTLAAALEGYSEIYLTCRGIQHRWEMTEDMHVTEKIVGGDLVERHLTCESCATVRKDRF